MRWLGEGKDGVRLVERRDWGANILLLVLVGVASEITQSSLCI